jgi:hypothetical protein
MSWGTSWDIPDGIASGIVFTKTTVDNGDLKVERIPNAKIYLNQVPTHDPYTNPNAQLYYSCGCGAIFDPGTKRFAELNNAASNAGWKIRFSDRGYVPYCVECGKGVE